MPYLRITARTIPIDVRRRLVNDLTAATLRLMPWERASWTSVHFTDIDPERFATESRLVVDGQTPDVQLELMAAHVPTSTRRALIDRLTGILMNAYKMHGEDIYRVNIKFTEYDALRDFAVGGRFASRLVPLSVRLAKNAVPFIATAFSLGALAVFANHLVRGSGPAPLARNGEVGQTAPIERDSQLPQAVLED